jgi:amino acid transporter
LTGYSYAKLGLAYHSDGGSFTYLEHAFKHRNISGIDGWLLLTGYIGKMALYAYTFGVYGAAMFGNKGNPDFHYRYHRHLYSRFAGR